MERQPTSLEEEDEHGEEVELYADEADVQVEHPAPEGDEDGDDLGEQQVSPSVSPSSSTHLQIVPLNPNPENLEAMREMRKQNEILINRWK